MRYLHLVLTSLCLLAAGRPAQGQVQINFANNANTAITNCVSGARVVSGNTFRVALYIGPAGATESGLTVLATTGFSSPGVFNGGNVIVPGFSPGATVTLQVRCWETAFGATYEQAVAAGCLSAFGRPALTGKSPLVIAVLSGSPNPPLTLPGARVVPFLVCGPPCVPLITCPADILVECTNSLGNIVTFAPTASSPCCPINLVLTCVPPSGSRFSPGFTAVRCTANDLQNAQSNSCLFAVRVRDTLPPSIVCPSNLVANADPGLCTKSNVTYTISASDTCGLATLRCEPPSGSTFGRGVTTVTCTATDPATNRASCSFTVTIVCTAPVITAQPVSLTVTQGAAAQFTLTATAVPSPTYQWRFNRTPILGATSNVLALVDVGPEQVGDYDALVSNAAGSLSSAVVRLNLVDEAPVLSIALTAGAMTICWPETALGFRLEGSSDLGKPGAWNLIDGVSQPQKGQECRIVPLENTPRFFRLVR